MATTNSSGMPSPSDPDYILWLLEHSTDQSGDPNWQKNQQLLMKATGGLDFNGRYEGNNIARYLMPLLFQQYAMQQANYNQMLPAQMGAQRQQLAELSNPDLMASQYQSQASAAGASTLTQTLNRLKSMGVGIGGLEGATQASANQVTSAGNAYRADMNSPQGRYDRQAAISGITQGSMPNFGNLTTLSNVETGTPRNQTGLDAFAGLLGNLSATIPTKGGGSITL